MATVAVLAYAGTEELLRALWKKKFSGEFKVFPVDGGGNANHELLGGIASVMADPEIDEDFILVQANCFPAAPCDVEKLQIPMVYVNAEGKELLSSRLPVRLNKGTIAELLGTYGKEEDFEPETFFRKATEGRGRAIAAGHTFGNVVFQVLSGSPCRNKVIGALLTKHYVAASLTGWNAIRDILEDYLKSKR